MNCKNGVSSYEVSRDLKISQKAAWFVLQRLRHILKDTTLIGHTDSTRFFKALSQVANRLLTYAELTGKEAN